MSLTELIVYLTVRILPALWRDSSPIDDEMIDFVRRGGWNKLDFSPPSWRDGHRYGILKDTPLRGFKVRVYKLSLVVEWELT